MSSVPRMTPGACLLTGVGHGAPNDKWFALTYYIVLLSREKIYYCGRSW